MTPPNRPCIFGVITLANSKWKDKPDKAINKPVGANIGVVV